MKAFFVYGLFAPNSDVVRYIGCTEFPQNRLRQHIEQAKKGIAKSEADQAKNAWIRKLLSQRKKPEFYILHAIKDRRLALTVESKMQQIHAATITNPRKFPAGRQDNPALLLAVIEELTEELFSQSRAWGRLRHRYRECYDIKQLAETYSDGARRRVDEIRGSVGLLALNPVLRRKQKQLSA